MTRISHALCVLCALASCRHRDTGATARAEPSAHALASGSSRPAAKLEPKAPSASAITPPPAPPVAIRQDAPLDSACQAALLRARQHQANGELEQAKAEFLLASGRDETVNLQPLVELGYLELTRLSGKDDEAEILLRAGTTSSDPTLEAQAWYNLALLYARRGESEAERAALSRSLARRDNKTVRAKLQGRSTCVAEIQRGAGSSPAVVTGWRGVCEKLDLCGDTSSPAQARHASCVDSSFNGTEPDKSHDCPDPGPWETTFGYSWFRYNSGFIAPLSKGRFFVDVTRAGSWPAACQSGVAPTWKQLGAYVVASLQADELSQVPGRPTPQMGEANGACTSGQIVTITAVYAAETAALLAAVSVVAEHPVDVRFDEPGKRLVLSGGGCDGYVPANGRFRFVPARP